MSAADDAILIAGLREQGEDGSYEAQAAGRIEQLTFTASEDLLYQRRLEARLATEHDAWQTAQNESHKLVEQQAARIAALVDERDAWKRQHYLSEESWRDENIRRKQAESEVAALRKVIENAPHIDSACDCWKSKVNA